MADSGWERADRRFVIVTALYRLPGKDACYETLLARTKRLVCACGRAGVPIVLFCEDESQHKWTQSLAGNVLVVGYRFKDTATYRLCLPCTGLPRVRNADKDTHEYMVLMCCKFEFVAWAAGMMCKQPFGMMWCDSGILKILGDDEDVLTSLLEQNRRCVCERLRHPVARAWMTAPGDMRLAHARRDFSSVAHRVDWRFNGGVFMCNAQGAYIIADLFMGALAKVIEYQNTMVWEINILASIEEDLDVRLDLSSWYADHNTDMVQLWQSPWIMYPTS